MHVLNVVGARPNLMKIAPIIEVMQDHPFIESSLLHTGQHYDERMSKVFFDELGIPKPDIYLGVGSGSHAHQTARVMVAFEEVLDAQRPDVVVVVGDVNSTLACAITAKKQQITVAHVEAGLRSFDRRMPEEINRIVTDALSDLLFTTAIEANENLLREGVPEDQIFFVGNVMIDTLNKHREKARVLRTPKQFGMLPHEYALLTLHRPSNVDDLAVLDGILGALMRIQESIPILFPAHPRTIQRIGEFGFGSRMAAMPNLKVIPAQGYLAFMDLMMHARLVLTDSGGIQEETTVLGVPCLTLRENTERPITITQGTNQLVGTDPVDIVGATNKVLAGSGIAPKIPECWDGHAAERILNVLESHVPAR
jgi:UDP-N-acetylglucosamine 2-epimerase (non-hydrolysing)